MQTHSSQYLRRFVRPPRLVILAASLALLALGGSAAVADDGQRTLRPKTLKIVNGELTAEYESTVALLDETGESFCSGVLIGCSTVLTAAHCLCDEVGSECGPGGPGLLTSADQITVFTQHGGFAGVDSFDVNEDFSFGVGDDIALLHLSSEISGIQSAKLNDVSDPSPSTPGVIAGFGFTTKDPDTEDAGLKRAGAVSLQACEVVPNGNHLCWQFDEPLGMPGDNSTTCEGDSGGPLFIDESGELLLAGVSSGGTSDECQAPDEGFDTNIFRQLSWIQQFGGSDVGSSACGDLPAAGSTDALAVSGSGQLNPSRGRETWSLDVPAKTQLLRVAVNGADPAGNDFDLAVRFEQEPTGSGDDCTSDNQGMFEVCDIVKPAAGEWVFAVDRFSGEGEYQIVATAFAVGSGNGGGDICDDDGGGDGGDGSVAGACPDGSEALCLGDGGRFRVSVTWRDFEGDTGIGQAVAIDRADSGLFYFFGEDNLELLVKVLDGCGINQHYWVFSAATTTVEYTLTVEDTVSGEVRTYPKAIDIAAPPVTDTSAFEVCS